MDLLCLVGGDSVAYLLSEYRQYSQSPRDLFPQGRLPDLAGLPKPRPSETT